MKINEKKKVREVAGEHIVISIHAGAADMTEVVGLNSSAWWLYQQLQGREFDVDEVARLLMEEYEVDADRARRDAELWVEQMVDKGLIVNE